MDGLKRHQNRRSVFLFNVGNDISIGSTNVFLEGDDELEGVSKFIRAPFAVSLSLAVLSYLGGWVIALVIELIATIIRGATGSAFLPPP